MLDPSAAFLVALAGPPETARVACTGVASNSLERQSAIEPMQIVDVARYDDGSLATCHQDDEGAHSRVATLERDEGAGV